MGQWCPRPLPSLHRDPEEPLVGGAWLWVGLASPVWCLCLHFGRVQVLNRAAIPHTAEEDSDGRCVCVWVGG